MKRIVASLLPLVALLLACTFAANIVPAGIPPTNTLVAPTATLTPSPTATFTLTPTNTPTPTATPGPLCLKIMPLGDSITFGEPDTGYGSYRNLQCCISRHRCGKGTARLDGRYAEHSLAERFRGHLSSQRTRLRQDGARLGKCDTGDGTVSFCYLIMRNPAVRRGTSPLCSEYLLTCQDQSV